MTLRSELRNVLIILVLAAAVAFIQAGRTAASVIGSAAILGFLGAFAWIGMVLYREHRMALYALGIKRRSITYAAAGVAVVVLCATSRMWSTPAGSIAWLVLLGGAGWALFAVYRSTREY